ncbi:MAG: type II toxin-antitoxin system VapC family toxin [Planctomycetes bacterium]|nr:type II toxin-antitoxin system VapC family toxin [Planctomycetota bacterium]
MYIFDSDHLSFLQKRRGPEFESIAKQLENHPSSFFFVTIVSFHEQFNGWLKFIARTKEESDLVRGYTELQHVVLTFAKAQVLGFNVAVADVYAELRRSRIRIGAIDLRIASIAIANQMTLLTRNTVDFERIHNLTIEDWTKL